MITGLSSILPKYLKGDGKKRQPRAEDDSTLLRAEATPYKPRSRNLEPLEAPVIELPRVSTGPTFRKLLKDAKRPTQQEVEDYLQRRAPPQTLAQYSPPRPPSHLARRQAHLEGLEIAVRPVLPPSVPPKNTRYLRPSQSATNLANGSSNRKNTLPPRSTNNARRDQYFNTPVQRAPPGLPAPRQTQSHADLRRQRGNDTEKSLSTLPRTKQTFYQHSSESDEDLLPASTYEKPVTRRFIQPRAPRNTLDHRELKERTFFRPESDDSFSDDSEEDWAPDEIPTIEDAKEHKVIATHSARRA